MDLEPTVRATEMRRSAPFRQLAHLLHGAPADGAPMIEGKTRRRVAFVLLGVAAFVLKRSYGGPLAEVVHDWGGNFAVSFAVYFLSAIAAGRLGTGKLAAAAAALLAVDAFELTSGFGLMANVYDPVDLLANAVGIGVALLVDQVAWRLAAGRAPG